MSHSSRPAPSLPVTVISGFVGAGKTTLINHLLNNANGLRIGVLVNDMSSLSPAARMIKSRSTPIADTAAEVIELNNGCICCTLRDEFVARVAAMARRGELDSLIVEATGISEPLPIALTFEQPESEGRILGELAHLDTLVTVVDARHFLSDWDRAAPLSELGIALDESDSRTTADLLAEQVEAANVVLVNKADLVGADDLERLCSVLRNLNPESDLVTTMFGVVPLDSVLLSESFDPTRLGNVPPWDDGRAADRFGVSSFVYRARRPFHPDRLWEVLHSEWPGVLRSKGLFWLASRMTESGFWSQAGAVCSAEGAGRWWATVPESDWPEDEDLRGSIADEFKGPFGDRRQELVVVGIEMDQVALRKRLDQCLLDDDEMKMGPIGWLHLNDPFPTWSTDQEDESQLQVRLRRELPQA
jgi:G3E family GTPase